MAIDQNRSTSRNRVHPQKFALWLAMGSIIMMFGAFTSAYIVKQAGGNWIDFKLPTLFYWSTAIIVISSITLHLSYTNFVRANFKAYKALLLVSLMLGFTFIALQYNGWDILYASGVDLKGSPSGSFLYLITGVHAAHVLGGIAAIIVAVIHAFTLKEKVTSLRKHRFQLTYNYWHFMGFLWIYLLAFLLLSK